MMLTRGIRSALWAASSIGKRSLQAGSLGRKEDGNLNQDEFTVAAEEEKKEKQRKRQEADEEEDLKDRILSAALKYVPELGWSSRAVQEGARESGLGNGVAAGGLIPSGGVELVFHHMKQSDEALEKSLVALGHPSVEKRPDFIRQAVEDRLKMNVPFLTCQPARWHEALALTAADPESALKHVGIDLERADLIWHHAGCKDSRGAWYARRVTLAGIYKSTELAMVNDKSRDFSETWAFLSRRFEDEGTFVDAVTAVGDVGHLLSISVATAINILGLPRR